MEFKIEKAIQEHALFGRQCGLLMIDADHFKAVNDTAGHDAADRGSLRSYTNSDAEHAGIRHSGALGWRGVRGPSDRCQPGDTPSGAESSSRNRL
jgi:hypothetical protein